MAKEIQKAVGAALVSLAPTTNTAIRIGYSNFTAEQIADNVDASVTALVEKWVPQKWRNMKSVYIKGPETTALPIWMTDELWIDDADVVAETEESKADKEKANIGKKRKSLDNTQEEAESPAPKKKAKKQLPAGDDDKLDKQISDRKTRLRKQKAAANKAVDN